MRIPSYLSPSSLKTFEKDPEEFYLKYLTDVRSPRLPQMNYMAVGSAFDAYVKSKLYYTVHGNYGPNGEYEKDKIFEDQVEPQNRDWGRRAGQYVYDSYVRSGALADLLLELNTSITEPRFEFSVQGVIKTTLGDVPLLGKPDISFVNDSDAKIIYDWKVNGFCSSRSVSPVKGYAKVRDCWLPNQNKVKASRNNCVAHPMYQPSVYLGVKCNGFWKMEDVEDEWAMQLATYGWLLGIPVGSREMVVGIDQIVNSGKQIDEFPLLRVANHRATIGYEFQVGLLARYANLWDCINSKWFFRDRSPEESKAKCDELEDIAVALSNTDDPMAAWINKVSRS